MASRPAEATAQADYRQHHAQPIALGLRDGDLSAEDPNQKCTIDIFYIRSGEGWLCLAVVTGLFAQRAAG
ncbi:hypothetical protein [Teichococcus aestuarii]|uniref:hypothetical protein n=1 Tax=Teichococcus aestuarii TaxID=568898 RepID=UPI00360A2EA2